MSAKPLLLPAIQSKFLNIQEIQHRFPEAIRGIDIQIALLHTHKHGKGYALVYMNGYTEAIYMAKQDAELKFYPCSWYLEDGKVIAYEYSDEPCDFDLEKITKDLTTIENMGFNNYGTTARPLKENMCELETEQGHIYIPLENYDTAGKSYSETVTNGKKVGWCFSVCLNINGRHGGIHR